MLQLFTNGHLSPHFLRVFLGAKGLGFIDGQGCHRSYLITYQDRNETLVFRRRGTEVVKKNGYEEKKKSHNLI